MKNLEIIKNEEGASLIEMLFALAFIGMTIGAFINLAIFSLRLSLTNRTQSSLGQHASLVAEEVVKDYSLNGFVDEDPCEIEEVVLFLDEFDTNDCVFEEFASGEYKVTLTVDIYDRTLSSERNIILK